MIFVISIKYCKTFKRFRLLWISWLFFQLLNTFELFFVSAIFENIIEFRPEVVVDVAKQGLLQWLLKRLRIKAPFDANKLYVSEILSILLQSSIDNKSLLGTLDGIDVLLQQLAVSK